MIKKIHAIAIESRDKVMMSFVEDGDILLCYRRSSPLIAAFGYISLGLIVFFLTSFSARKFGPLHFEFSLLQGLAACFIFFIVLFISQAKLADWICTIQTCLRPTHLTDNKLYIQGKSISRSDVSDVTVKGSKVFIIFGSPRQKVTVRVQSKDDAQDIMRIVVFWWTFPKLYRGNDRDDIVERLRGTAELPSIISKFGFYPDRYFKLCD